MERSEQELVRIEKLDKIRECCNPYPDKYDRTHTLKEARLLPDDTSDVRIAGRIVFMRKMGKLSFIRIRDIEADMQLEMKIDVNEDRVKGLKILARDQIMGNKDEDELNEKESYLIKLLEGGSLNIVGIKLIFE